ncbi:MAG: hypothetical protein K2J76_00440, partial [Oscillospiraceae bacterium]|nr:hypothetical protein [Oscillospiraceae bacterium]
MLDKKLSTAQATISDWETIAAVLTDFGHLIKITHFVDFIMLTQIGRGNPAPTNQWWNNLMPVNAIAILYLLQVSITLSSRIE